ncbi:MAG: hypothetical protein Q4A86_02395 [Clostridia bacterium]|nr:hypothetical protein [Clostridia bacterium]
MDLRRLKTIFIFVLIALNIMFGAVLYNAYNYEKEERQIMVESLTTLLAKDMIYLPQRLELPHSPEIYSFYLEKMFGHNDDLVTRFLGEIWEPEQNGGYVSEKGSLLLDGDEFKFFNKNPEGSVTDFSEENIESLCRDEMQRLGILSNLYVFSGVNFVDDGIKAIFTARHEDSVFFDAYISFDVSEKGIVTISGRNMVSDLTVSSNGTDFFSITSILPDLSRNAALEKGVAHTIVSITPGYYIGKTAESYRNILAIPVWQIATDSGKIIYYDARNGMSIDEQ